MLTCFFFSSKEVKINGVPAARENGIGIIHQEIVMVPYLTVAQNLFLGREIETSYKTVNKAEIFKRYFSLLHITVIPCIKTFQIPPDHHCHGHSCGKLDHCPTANGGNCKGSFF